jgi:hypothetical protein
MSSNVQELLTRQDTPLSAALKNNVFKSHRHVLSADCFSLPRAASVAVNFFFLGPTQVKTIHMLQQRPSVSMDPDRFHTERRLKVVPLRSTP